MKYLPIVAGALLGLLFAASGAVVLLKLAPMPPLPEGSPAAHFMAAGDPSGYPTFVKMLEVVGGELVAVPKTRSLGLLVLGPIVLNIPRLPRLCHEGRRPVVSADPARRGPAALPALGRTQTVRRAGWLKRNW